MLQADGKIKFHCDVAWSLSNNEIRWELVKDTLPGNYHPKETRERLGGDVLTNAEKLATLHKLNVWRDCFEYALQTLLVRRHLGGYAASIDEQLTHIRELLSHNITSVDDPNEKYVEVVGKMSKFAEKWHKMSWEKDKYLDLHTDPTPWDFGYLGRTHPRSEGPDDIGKITWLSCAEKIDLFLTNVPRDIAVHDVGWERKHKPVENYRAWCVSEIRNRVYFFLLGFHGRLGVQSPVGLLCDDVLDIIFGDVANSFAQLIH